MSAVPLSKISTTSRVPIIGRDPTLQALLARAARVAPTGIPVLVNGESGTGKELIAELLHRLGPHPSGPLVAVNCGALPRELAESELFGHERGAFTGAATRKAGWFTEADGGTLVLDEIGELPRELQPKLLRVLETGRLRRVGGVGEVAVRTRIVALTLRDLRREVDRGAFRNDLYHRLAGFELTLPPLRGRPSDIPLLADYFLDELRRELGAHILEDDAREALVQYDWPGNIRELRNVLRRAAVLGHGRISAASLELPRGESLAPRQHTGGWVVPNPAAAAPTHLADESDAFLPDPGTAVATTEEVLAVANNDQVALRGRTFDQIERQVLGWALTHNGGSRRRAARALGLPRSSFCDKVKRYGLA